MACPGSPLKEFKKGSTAILGPRGIAVATSWLPRDHNLGASVPAASHPSAASTEPARRLAASQCHRRLVSSAGRDGDGSGTESPRFSNVGS